MEGVEELKTFYLSKGFCTMQPFEHTVSMAPLFKAAVRRMPELSDKEVELLNYPSMFTSDFYVDTVGRLKEALLVLLKQDGRFLEVVPNNVQQSFTQQGYSTFKSHTPQTIGNGEQKNEWHRCVINVGETTLKFSMIPGSHSSSYIPKVAQDSERQKKRKRMTEVSPDIEMCSLHTGQVLLYSQHLWMAWTRKLPFNSAFIQLSIRITDDGAAYKDGVNMEAVRSGSPPWHPFRQLRCIHTAKEYEGWKQKLTPKFRDAMPSQPTCVFPSLPKFYGFVPEHKVEIFVPQAF